MYVKKIPVKLHALFYKLYATDFHRYLAGVWQVKALYRHRVGVLTTSKLPVLPREVSVSGLKQVS